MKNTITTSLRVMQSGLYSRDRLFEDTAGVAIDKAISTLRTELVNPIELSAVSNFLMISTDATVELVLHQVDSSDRLDVKVNTVVLPVTAFFMSYSRFPKVIVRRVSGSQRIPKVALIYA